MSWGNVYLHSIFSQHFFAPWRQHFFFSKSVNDFGLQTLEVELNFFWHFKTISEEMLTYFVLLKEVNRKLIGKTPLSMNIFVKNLLSHSGPEFWETFKINFIYQIFKTPEKWMTMERKRTCSKKCALLVKMSFFFLWKKKISWIFTTKT